MAEKRPRERIKELFDERVEWSDRKLLAELKSLPVLPDEGDPAWEEDSAWEMACLYVAHADLARARRLIGAIPLLYERASYGDPGEMMRGLRHQMEAIVDPTWPVLTRLSMRAAKYPQRGARLWAIRQLGVLRDTAAFGTLVAALTDEAELVRAEARLALEMCCQTNESIRAGAIEALSKFVAKRRRKAEREDARKAIEAIREMK